MNAIIIDDEKSQREVVRKLVEKNHENIEIIAEAQSVKTGIETILKHQPELIFMDIELLDGTGFDILEHVRHLNFKLIFVTGFNDYAIKAFKYSALDYILKPINTVDFYNAVRKAVAEINHSQEMAQLEVLLDNYKNNIPEKHKIILKNQERMYIVDCQSIIRCQSENSYISFYLDDGEIITVTSSLKEYEDILSQFKFFRVHQSHLVNINHIKEFNKRKGGNITMIDDSKIPLSQRKRLQFLDFIKHFGI